MVDDGLRRRLCSVDGLVSISGEPTLPPPPARFGRCAAPPGDHRQEPFCPRPTPLAATSGRSGENRKRYRKRGYICSRKCTRTPPADTAGRLGRGIRRCSRRRAKRAAGHLLSALRRIFPGYGSGRAGGRDRRAAPSGALARTRGQFRADGRSLPPCGARSTYYR